MEPITEYLIKTTVTASEVKAWEEVVMLPTYEPGKEEKNPIFLEKRVYQGSSGVVYPYPVIEKISDEKKDKPYRAFFIENEYVKLMILPELGGRIHMAYDKVKQRHFVYYNQVVKPALVGLTGPWISGGIEFNWPQHHRPTTFMPTDCYIEEHEDGSKTVWCSEVERMFRTKGMAGFTLYPGKAYVEINAKVYNRTCYPQTFLWWANPAVVVNDTYFSVFPPDVNAVFDHGKRDVSSFPIATGEYYKVDYSAGVDISRYKNIPVPTSYMAINSKYDFVGGYDESCEAGLLHVADHHVNAGKKQWTWGCGDFGKAWDRNLTDEDGPYIELMTGMYCDNQPDFAWLQPYEEKSWKQYFMPYQKVGLVKNAGRDAIVNVEKVDEEHVRIIVYATAIHSGARILLSRNGQPIVDVEAYLSPADSFDEIVEFKDDIDDSVKLTVFDENANVMVSYKPEKPEIRPIPDPAKAAKLPEEISSIEQLFLTGQHLEQYRHATYNPMDYYAEALKREPGDIRCNNSVGLLLMRKGQFAKAQPYFEAAIKTQTERNPNPYDGEPYFNLGWCRQIQGDYDGAYDAYYKSTWNAAWQAPGYFALAQIDARRGRWESALELVDRALVNNWHNHKARHLKALILRRLGRLNQALNLIAQSLVIDKFNMGCRFENLLILSQMGRDEELFQSKTEFKKLMRGASNSYLEYSLDYSAAGQQDTASQLLALLLEDGPVGNPMVFYALGYYAWLQDANDEAVKWYKRAAEVAPDYCFPNKNEEILILQNAIMVNPEDSKAPYYLGNLWYGARQYDEAIECWELSARLNDSFSTVWRNLSLAYYNKRNDSAKALKAIEKAFALDTTDARVLMELDQLYKKLKYPHAQRLAFLDTHSSLVELRDDLCIERITLLNQLGRYDEARTAIALRKFHPWEGGEGKVTGQYLICHVELAKIALKNKQYDRAIELLHDAEVYPENLGEGKLAMAEENDIHYFLGCAYHGAGDEARAEEYFKKATVGSSEPAIAFFYNDQQPDKIFYQGLAWRKLGREDKARSCFNKLVKHGEKHLFDHVRIDYFAVSLPDLLIWDDDLNVRNLIHCNLVMGLGYLGLGEEAKARKYLGEVIELDLNHQVAAAHLAMC